MPNDTTVFIGLDVHKDSIAVACVGSGLADAPVDVGTIGTQQYALDRLIKKLSGRGPLRFVYEAGPCGFWLQRYLRSVGQDCVVAAPSLIPRRPGVRIKTVRLDARNLALALRAATLTAMHIPAPEEEAFRDVVRACQQCKRDVTAAKQRLKAFLLRNDIRYEGRATWSAAHRRWLARLVLHSPAQQIVFQELVDAVNERERRRDRLEVELPPRSVPSSSNARKRSIRASATSPGKRSCGSLANTAASARAANTPISSLPRSRGSSAASSGTWLDFSSTQSSLSDEGVRRVADRCRG